MVNRIIKSVMGYKMILVKDIAEESGLPVSGVSKRLASDNMCEQDIAAIAEAMNCDIEFKLIDRDSGRVFSL